MTVSSFKIKISALVIFISIVVSVFVFDLHQTKAQNLPPGITIGEIQTYHNGVRVDAPQGGIISSTPLDDPFARTERNVQASQEQAQNIQQNQQQDMQKCMAEGSALQGPLNNALQTGLGQVMGNTLNDALPNALQAEIVEKLPAELTNTAKQLLPQKLGDRIKNDLSASIGNVLQEATDELGRPLTELEQKDIFKTELSASIQNNFADAFKESIRESFPIAIENSIRKGLPEAVSSVLQEQLPGQISSQMPGIMQQELGPEISNLLIDQFSSIVSGGQFDPTSLLSIAPGLIEGIVGGLQDLGENIANFFGDLFGIETEDGENDNNISNATSITPELVGQITDEMMDEYISRSIDLINENMDDIIAQANSALDESMDDIISSIEDELDSVLDETLDELDSVLEDTLDGVLDELTGPFEELIDGTLGSLDGVFDDLTGVFDDITGELTGVINQVTGTLTNTLSTAMNQVTGTLTGTLNQVVNSITTPINDAISGVVSNVITPITDTITGAITTPINNITSNLTENILNPVTGAFDGVVSNITGGLTSAAGSITGNVLANAGVPEVIAGPVGDAVSNVAAGVVSNIPGLGAITGIAGIGVFVPVKETSGPLLSSTQSIDKTNASIDATTQRIEQLTIEICTQLKSIKRIQTAFEQKEFVEDVDLRRQANEASEQYRNELIDFSKKGYDSTGEGPDAPLYVENPLAHLNELVIPEATIAYVDDLAKSDNSFKFLTSNQLLNNFNQPSNRSSISLDKYNDFVANNITDEGEWFSTFMAINNPFEPNSPETSYMINSQKLAATQQNAAQDFYEQLVAGNGYLPVRECEERTEAGTCKRWKVITPASQVQEVTAEALNYRLDLYKNADPGDVSPGGGPTLEETRTNTPSAGGGGGSNPGGDIGGIINILQQFLSGFLSGNNGEGNELVLDFSHTIPTATEITSGTNRVARLNWDSPQANTCTATSDWISSSNPDQRGPLLLAVEEGDALENSGQIDITLPIQFNIDFIRKRNNVENLIPVTIEASHINQTHTLILDDSIGIEAGDSIIVRLWPYTASSETSITVTDGDTSSAIINKLYTAIVNAQNDTTQTFRASLFKRYTFTPNSTASSIAIKPKLVYKISCTKNEDVAEQIINLN